MNQDTAVEETDESAIVCKCTMHVFVDVCVSGGKEGRKKEMNVIHTRLCLITSSRIEYEGINYAHSPTECSALGKQEDTVYS